MRTTHRRHFPFPGAGERPCLWVVIWMERKSLNRHAHTKITADTARKVLRSTPTRFVKSRRRSFRFLPNWTRPLRDGPCRRMWGSDADVTIHWLAVSHESMPAGRLVHSRTAKVIFFFTPRPTLMATRHSPLAALDWSSFFLLFSFFLEGGSVSLKGRFLFRTAMCTTRLMSFFCVFIDGVRRETSATVWRPHPSVLSSTAQMDAFRRLHSINGTNLTRWYRFFLVRHLSSRLYGTELNRLHDRNGCGGGCNSVLELSFFFTGLHSQPSFVVFVFSTGPRDRCRTLSQSLKVWRGSKEWQFSSKVAENIPPRSSKWEHHRPRINRMGQSKSIFCSLILKYLS